jgi:CubicO group peptidase (beta-lactamase class C family)
MTRDQLTPEQKAAGGLGSDYFADLSWGFCQAVYSNGGYGWDGGLGTSWLVDTANDLIVIALTQRMFETSSLPRLHREIRGAAFATIG